MHSTEQIVDALVAAGWDREDLHDANDLIERVREAVEIGRDALAHAIIGGASTGEAMESADAILAHLEGE